MRTAQRPDTAHAYTYRVAWSPEDDEYVATCVEFPSLSWLAASQADALEGLVALVADTITDLRDQGEDVPDPLATRDYSGKFGVRVGRHLHQRLVTEAAESHISLNQLIVNRLAKGD